MSAMTVVIVQRDTNVDKEPAVASVYTFLDRVNGMEIVTQVKFVEMVSAAVGMWVIAALVMDTVILGWPADLANAQTEAQVQHVAQTGIVTQALSAEMGGARIRCFTI